MFIATLPPRNILPPLPDAPALPKKSKRSHKVTLVLDLDETLVHCTLHPTERHDVTFAVPFQGEDFKVYVRKRPHFDKFVEEVGRKFEVVIFTASQQVYADRLLDILDPERTWSKHRLFRDSCLPVLGNYLKDLNILGRDLSKAVIVDNSPHVFGYQVRG
jgi:CTD small phosphatase-like protein 2